MIEVSKGLEISLFLRFREFFESLSYKDFSNLCFMEIEEEFEERKNKVIKLIKMF